MLSTASPVNSSKLIFLIFEVLVWISCRRSLNVVSVLYQKPGDFKCLLVENKETLLTNSGFSASNHPRRPRGCQLGRDKRRRKGYYSKQTSSTTYSNACLWLGRKKWFCVNRRPASIVLLSWSSLPANSTVPWVSEGGVKPPRPPFPHPTLFRHTVACKFFQAFFWQMHKLRL